MSFNFKEYKNDLLFVPLGGSNEIGMNLNLYHIDGKWLMVDLGIGFADDYLPGVEVVVPDIEFVLDIKEDLLGLVITHAHEDHLGAVPYLWEEIGCPIFATGFTASVIKNKMAAEGKNLKNLLKIVQPGKDIELGPFRLEMVGLTHSIPEMQAIAIHTKKGTVLHTGDWKFDPDPLVGAASDVDALKRLGDNGVAAMICDSTNVFVEGESGSEAEVRKHMVEVIKECKNRVAVTTFASNLARIETIVEAGVQAGRKIGMAGRSLWRIAEAARENGYMKDAPEFYNEKQIMEFPKDEVLIICTGCQGEPLAALSKMARSEHPAIRLTPGDTVLFASRKIPGNESRINWMHNQFIDMQVEVITADDRFVHVSGHPARDELAAMYQMVRPKIAVPVHGEPRHIHEHAKFARTMQVPEAVEARNGAVINLTIGDAGVIGMVHSGYMAVDGNSIIPTDSPVIRTRRRLRDEGCVVATLVMDEEDELVTHPVIAAPGCLDDHEDAELIDAIRESIADEMERLTRGAHADRIKEVTRAAIRRVLNKEIGKKPIIEVKIVRV